MFRSGGRGSVHHLRGKNRRASDLDEENRPDIGIEGDRWIQFPKEGIPKVLEPTDRMRPEEYEPYEPEIHEIVYSQWERDQQGKLKAKLVENAFSNQGKSFQWIHFKSKDPAATAKYITSMNGQNHTIRLYEDEKFLFERLKENLDTVQDRQYQMLTQGGAWDIRTWYEDNNSIPHYAKTSCIPFHSRSFKADARQLSSRMNLPEKGTSWREIYGPKDTDKTNSIVAFCSKSVLVTIAPSSLTEMIGSHIVLERAADSGASASVDGLGEPDDKSVIRVLTEHGQSYIFPFEHCKTWFTLLCFVRASCFRERQIDIEACKFYLRRGGPRIEIDATNWFQRLSLVNRIVLDLDMEEPRGLPVILDVVPVTSFSEKPKTYELPPQHHSKRLWKAYRKYRNLNDFVGNAQEATKDTRYRNRQLNRAPLIITAEPDFFDSDDPLGEPTTRFTTTNEAGPESLRRLQTQLVAEFQSFASELVMDMAQQVAYKLLQAQMPSSDVNASGHIDTRLDTTASFFDWVGSFGRIEYLCPGLSTSNLRGSPGNHDSELLHVSTNGSEVSNLASPLITYSVNTKPVFEWPVGYARIRDQMRTFSVSAGLRMLMMPNLPLGSPDFATDGGGSSLPEVSRNIDHLIVNLLDPEVLRSLNLPLHENARGVDNLLSHHRKKLAPSLSSREALPLAPKDHFIDLCDSLYSFFFPKDHNSYASLIYWTAVQKILKFVDSREASNIRLIKEMDGLLHDVQKTADFIKSGVQQTTIHGHSRGSCVLGKFYVIPKSLPDAFLVLVQYLSTVSLLLDTAYIETLVEKVAEPEHQPTPSWNSSKEPVKDEFFQENGRTLSQDSYTPESKALRLKIQNIERQKNYLDGKLIILMRRGCDQLISMDGYAFKKYTENCDSPNTESLILQIIQSLLERNYEVEKTSFQTSLSRINKMTGAGIDQTEMHAIRGQLKEVITARNVLSQQMQVLDSFQRNSDWSGRSFEHLLECTATARMNKALLKRTREIVSRQLGEIEKFEIRFRQEFERASRIVELNKETSEVALMVFTTVTTIFLPLSVVTGYFGMNTSDIREMTAKSEIFWKTAAPVVLLFVAITVPVAFYWRNVKKVLKGLWDFVLRAVVMGVLATGKMKES